MNFISLRPGDSAIIAGLGKGDDVYRKKLLAMGLVPGAKIEVLRKAPLGDPIEIRVGKTLLSLRKKEAEIIIIRKEGDG